MASLSPELRQFSALRQDVEAVLQRCGRDTWELVLIDLEGEWTMAVFTSEEEATAAAAQLEVPLHRGWDEDRLAQRMSRHDPWRTRGIRRAL